MYRTWLFLLCVFLFLQPDMMVIDTFEDDGKWEEIGSSGCTLELFLDQAIKREGSSSLRLEAVFPEDCDGTCYAGIMWQAPDLSDYTFLRLWTRLQTTAVDLKIGCFTPDDEPYVYSAPKMTGWYLVEVTVSQFENGEGQPLQTFGDIDRIFLVLTSEKPVTGQVHIDGFYALTDRNDNSIPDIDETSMIESAQTSENMADQHFEEKNYEQARKHYGEAISLYQQLGDTEKADEMDKKAKECAAWLDYEQAEALYAGGEYAEAAEAYERARREFVSAGNLDKTDAIERRLEEIQGLTGYSPESPPDQGTGTGVYGLLFLVLCFVGIGIYVWKFRKDREKTVHKKSTAQVDGGEEPGLVCPYCKNNIEEDWSSCPYCGAKLKEDTRIYE